MATHSSILAWKIPWIEEPGGLQSMVSRRIRHDLATKKQQQKLNPHALSCLFVPTGPLSSFPTRADFQLSGVGKHLGSVGLLWSQGVTEKAGLLQKILHGLAPAHPMTSLYALDTLAFLRLPKQV